MKRIIVSTALALVALGATTTVAIAASGTPEVDKAVATARQATEKYHDVNAALADGYVPVSGCVEVPGVGAMGFHYLNPAYASDAAIVANKPELLLYAPTQNGGLRLVGVEYFRADADQDLATDGDRPFFYGIPFDGPMAGHGPGMPVHFDLHVWAWQANPDGTFAQYNPNLHC